MAQDAAVLRPFAMAKREVLKDGPFTEAQIIAMGDDESTSAWSSTSPSSPSPG